MPQMKPMNWLILMIYFILNLIMTFLSMYYFKIKLPSNNKINKLNKNMKIMW